MEFTFAYKYAIVASNSHSKLNFSPPKNLNEIAHESTMDLIQMVLDHGVKLSKVFVDTVGPPASYEKKLTDHFMVCHLAPQTVVSMCETSDSLGTRDKIHRCKKS